MPKLYNIIGKSADVAPGTVTYDDATVTYDQTTTPYNGSDKQGDGAILALDRASEEKPRFSIIVEEKSKSFTIKDL